MRADFKYVLGGHGPLQSNRIVVVNPRNYIEEMAGKVQEGRKAGLPVEEMQKRFTVASLRSLQSNGYEAFLTRVEAAGHSHFGNLPPLQDGVNTNIGDILKNLDQA